MHSKTLLSTAIAIAAATAQQTPGNLTSVLADNDNLSSLAALLEEYPDLLETLGGASNITLLAPSNDAIDQFNSSGALANAQDISGAVPATLQYHVLDGMIMGDDISNTPTFAPTLLDDNDYTSLDNQVVEAVTEGGDVVFFGGFRNNATVSEADIEFDGGVIHIIDTVLTIPQNVTQVAIAANLTSLVGALTQANLVEDIGDLDEVTIFAPNNEAFRTIGSAFEFLDPDQLADILEYHVIENSVLYSSDLEETTIETLGGDDLTITISDGEIYVNGAQVILADVLISSGVVHVIDQVLNPNNPSDPPPGAVGAASDSASGTMTMSETVSGTMTMSETVSASATDAAAGGADNAFSASEVSDAPFTSGIATPTSSFVGLEETAAAADASASASASEDAGPAVTAAVGVAALFGGAAFMANF